MANRIIKESICTSENLATLSCQAERLFYRLMVQCDDYGLYFANSKIIKSKCFPLIADDIKGNQVQAWLDELKKAKLIFFYQVDGIQYLKFTKWEKHQQVRAVKPKFPLPVSVTEDTISDDINRLQVISDDINRNQPQSLAPRATNTNTNTNTNKGGMGEKCPPTLDDVIAYCKERKNSVDASTFIDFYSSKGWLVGKTKMVDWKAAVRTWERNSNKPQPQERLCRME